MTIKSDNDKKCAKHFGKVVSLQAIHHNITLHTPQNQLPSAFSKSKNFKAPIARYGSRT